MSEVNITAKVITSFHRDYFVKSQHFPTGNARTMVETYIKYWPKEIPLVIFYEGDVDEFVNVLAKDLIENPTHTIRVYDLFKDTDVLKFINKHKDRPDQQNRTELHKGAVRFARKSYSIVYGNFKSSTDFTIWLDADIQTFAPIDDRFFSSVLSQDKFVTFLGRSNNYTETGFLAFNNRKPVNDSFFIDWKLIYDQDMIFSLPQWHDCLVFDHLRKEMLSNEDQNNLTPWGQGYDHVFINSILGDYMDHQKGDNKKLTRSKQQYLITPKDHDYWKQPVKKAY